MRAGRGGEEMTRGKKAAGSSALSIHKTVSCMHRQIIIKQEVCQGEIEIW